MESIQKSILENELTDILGSTQTACQTHEVTFHTSQADADDVTSMGIPNDTNYTNTPQAGLVKSW